MGRMFELSQGKINMEGRLASINEKKNYGFIHSEGRKYFFHRENFHGHWYDLYADYQNGTEIRMSFDEDSDRGKGPRATNVRRLDYPNQS